MLDEEADPAGCVNDDGSRGRKLRIPDAEQYITSERVEGKQPTVQEERVQHYYVRDLGDRVSGAVYKTEHPPQEGYVKVQKRISF